MNSIMLMALGSTLDKTFYSLDMWFFEFFGKMQSSFLTIVAKFFTTFGDEKFVILFVLVAVALCFFKKTRKLGFALVLAMIIGTVITNGIAKPLFLRIRPYNTLQDNADYWSWYIGAGQLSESDFSFPSGHTTGATELCFVLFAYFMKNKKKFVAFIFPILAIFVAASRVYLMVHYVTDTIGAMFVGIVAGAIAIIVSKYICLIFEKVKFLDAIDAEKLFNKLDSNKKKVLSSCAISVAVVACFLVSFIPSLTEGGADAIRCDYNEDYDCQNEARCEIDENGNATYGDKYTEIAGHEGEFFCKYHWNQLNENNE